MSVNRVTVCLIALAVAVAVLAIASVGTASQPELSAGAGAPTMVSYQGQVKVAGVPYNGTGYFKFAIWSGSGGYNWTNDSTALGGGEPTASVELPVDNGLFNVLLGDTSLPNMNALDAEVFDEPERYLRVWFSNDDSTFTLLSPDQRIAAVPYAMHAEQVKGYANVVIVAKSGGDFTSIQEALDSIIDAGESNHYLVKVMPGEYYEQVMMKEYVDIEGSGELNTKILYWAIRTLTEGTLGGANNAELRFLSIENSGGDEYAVAIFNENASPRLTHVTAIASGGSQGFGVYNLGSSPVMTDVSVIIAGGTILNYGVYNQSSSPEMTNVTILVTNGWEENYGVYNIASSPIMTDVSIDVSAYTSEEGYSYGVFTKDSSSPVMTDVRAIAYGGRHNYGLYNVSGGVVTLQGGSFTGLGGEYAFGIYNSGVDTILVAESVTVLAEDCSDLNQGLYNGPGGVVTLRDGSFTSRGGNRAYGIRNYGSNTTLEAESITVLSEDSWDPNIGLINDYGGVVTLRGGSFTGRGGNRAYGILNDSSTTTLEAESITALGENGNNYNYGMYNYDSATVNANSSQFIGINDGLYLQSGTVHLGVSQLVGGATRAGGTLTCFQVYDGNYAAYTCP
ncbi:hypothetical protein ACFLUA_04140 [Chloroflexota bacterium]